MMTSVRAISMGLFTLILLTAATGSAQQFLDKEYPVAMSTETYDIDFGLQLDLYVPTGPAVPLLKPAMILVHGGGWADGSRDHLPFGSPGNQDSPVWEYALEFAKRGYVCASIDYRLFGNPNIAPTGLLDGLNLTPTASAVSALFGTTVSEGTLQPIIESGVQDLLHAVQWMVNNAVDLGVDPTRIAVGGYSAGGFNAMFASFLGNTGEIAAVWSNSGSLGGGGNEAVVLGGAAPVPTLVFWGDADSVVPYGTFGAPLETALNSEGVPHAFYTLAGEDHFYLKELIVESPPTKAVPDTIENLISEFMYVQLDLANLEQPIEPNPEEMPLANEGTLLLLALLLLGLTLWSVQHRSGVDKNT